MKTVETAILSTDLAMYFKKRSRFLDLIDNGEFDWQSDDKKECKDPNHRLQISPVLGASIKMYIFCIIRFLIISLIFLKMLQSVLLVNRYWKSYYIFNNHWVNEVIWYKNENHILNIMLYDYLFSCNVTYCWIIKNINTEC